MKIQLILLLAYANVASWVWMMSALTAEYGLPSQVDHVPLIGFAFSVWLALRVRRTENKALELNGREEN